MIALCTVLCGGESCVDMADFAEEKEGFLREFLVLENGLPSHDTFSRVFRALEPAQFRRCFQDFMVRFAETCQGVIAIDGKVLRRSFDAASAKSALHMVSAWGCEQRLVLGQIATNAKSNEITAVPKLLEMLSLKGCIVTVDALNCQREIARQIVDQGGDYALALKGNQGTLHDDVRRFLDEAHPAGTGQPVMLYCNRNLQPNLQLFARASCLRTSTIRIITIPAGGILRRRSRPPSCACRCSSGWRSRRFSSRHCGAWWPGR